MRTTQGTTTLSWKRAKHVKNRVTIAQNHVTIEHLKNHAHDSPNRVTPPKSCHNLTFSHIHNFKSFLNNMVNLLHNFYVCIKWYDVTSIKEVC